jgi:hypothetical protein
MLHTVPAMPADVPVHAVPAMPADVPVHAVPAMPTDVPVHAVPAMPADVPVHAVPAMPAAVAVHAAPDVPHCLLSNAARCTCHSLPIPILATSILAPRSTGCTQPWIAAFLVQSIHACMIASMQPYMYATKTRACMPLSNYANSNMLAFTQLHATQSTIHVLVVMIQQQNIICNVSLLYSYKQFLQYLKNEKVQRTVDTRSAISYIEHALFLYLPSCLHGISWLNRFFPVEAGDTIILSPLYTCVTHPFGTAYHSSYRSTHCK